MNEFKRSVIAFFSAVVLMVPVSLYLNSLENETAAQQRRGPDIQVITAGSTGIIYQADREYEVENKLKAWYCNEYLEEQGIESRD